MNDYKSTSARGTLRASAEQTQISREQWRAKRGATPVRGASETVGEMVGVPVVAKTQTTTTGTGDKS